MFHSWQVLVISSLTARALCLATTFASRLVSHSTRAALAMLHLGTDFSEPIECHNITG